MIKDFFCAPPSRGDFLLDLFLLLLGSFSLRGWDNERAPFFFFLLKSLL